MSESCESSLQQPAFVQFLPVVSGDVAERPWESAPADLPIRRSLMACLFLVAYVAAYVGVGFAGVALIERLWPFIAQ